MCSIWFYFSRGTSPVAAKCGALLMEKGPGERYSPCGKSQAIRWINVIKKYQISFKRVKFSDINRFNITLHDILTAMGTDYFPLADNCQAAAKRGWQLWTTGTYTPRFDIPDLEDIIRLTCSNSDEDDSDIIG